MKYLYKESGKVKPLARDGKKAQSVVKGGVAAFFLFGWLRKKSFFDLENPKKRKNIEYVP